MKAILFVILNVSVCFPRGLVEVEILILGGRFGGSNENFPGSLSLAMTPLQHTCNFYLEWIFKFMPHTHTEVCLVARRHRPGYFSDIQVVKS